MWENKILIDYGLLESNKKENNPIERMQQMYFLIKDNIIKNEPDFVVIEDVQFQSNYSTYHQLSQLQGVIFSLLYELNIGFTVVSPSAWRKFCEIKGRKRIEQKESAIQLVKKKYNIETSEDVCESILIGVWGISNIKAGDEL